MKRADDSFCETCAYWNCVGTVPIRPGKGEYRRAFGQCRRRMPQTHPGAQAAVWPVTEGINWCDYELDESSSENEQP